MRGILSLIEFASGLYILSLNNGKKKISKSLLLLSKSIFVLLLLLFALTSIGEKVILIEKPLGFPELIVPIDNPITAKIDLGRNYFRKIAFKDSSIFCASCHNPSFAFTDGLQKARGIKNREVSRNTPTLTNIAYNHSF